MESLGAAMAPSFVRTRAVENTDWQSLVPIALTLPAILALLWWVWHLMRCCGHSEIETAESKARDPSGMEKPQRMNPTMAVHEDQGADVPVAI